LIFVFRIHHSETKVNQPNARPDGPVDRCYQSLNTRRELLVENLNSVENTPRSFLPNGCRDSSTVPKAINEVFMLSTVDGDPYTPGDTTNVRMIGVHATIHDGHGYASETTHHDS
jgi:hypothetical protein